MKTKPGLGAFYVILAINRIGDLQLSGPALGVDILGARFLVDP